LLHIFTGSAGQQSVPSKFLEQLKISLPSMEVQRRVIKLIENIKEKFIKVKGLL